MATVQKHQLYTYKAAALLTRKRNKVNGFQKCVPPQVKVINDKTKIYFLSVHHAGIKVLIEDTCAQVAIIKCS